MRVDILCGCGWGRLGAIVKPGELVTCPVCGFVLGSGKHHPADLDRLQAEHEAYLESLDLDD